MFDKKILERMDGFEKGMKELIEAFDSDKKKDSTIEELYKKLQGYEGDIVFKFEKTHIIDLVYLFDCVTSQKKNIKQNIPGGITGNTRIEQIGFMESIFDTLIKEIIEILSKYDVELIEATSEKLNSEFQKVTNIIQTENQSEDQEVAGILRHGFKRNGKIIRPQEVSVKKFIKGDQNNEK